MPEGACRHTFWASFRITARCWALSPCRMKRAWAIDTVQGALERLPIEGHEVLAQVDEGLPPGA